MSSTTVVLRTSLNTDDHTRQTTNTPGFKTQERGGDSHLKVTGMLVVSLRGVNCRFWSHLECSGRKAKIFTYTGIA